MKNQGAPQKRRARDVVSEKDCPCFDDLLLFGAPGAKHLRNPVKMWLEYLMGNMRNAKISRLSCIVLVFLLGVLSSHHLVAGGEELATSGDDSQSVSDETDDDGKCRNREIRGSPVSCVDLSSRWL